MSSARKRGMLTGGLLVSAIIMAVAEPRNVWVFLGALCVTFILAMIGLLVLWRATP